jgi:hypothetical protein
MQHLKVRGNTWLATNQIHGDLSSDTLQKLDPPTGQFVLPLLSPADINFMIDILYEEILVAGVENSSLAKCR